MAEVFQAVIEDETSLSTPKSVDARHEAFQKIQKLKQENMDLGLKIGTLEVELKRTQEFAMKAAKEAAAKEATVKQVAKKAAAREAASKVAKEVAAKEAAAKEAAAEQLAKKAAAKEAAAKEAAAKEAAAKYLEKEAAAKEAVAEQLINEAASKELASREAVAKESASNETITQNTTTLECKRCAERKIQARPEAIVSDYQVETQESFDEKKARFELFAAEQKEQAAIAEVATLRIRVQELLSDLDSQRHQSLDSEKLDLEAKLKASEDGRQSLAAALSESRGREARLAGALRHAEESLVDAYRARATASGTPTKSPHAHR